jgi:exodeoxyribonuclease V alpha subunit
MDIATIKALKHQDGFVEIDLHFANFIVELVNSNNVYLYLAAALSSAAVRKSHVCAKLNNYAGQPFPQYRDDVSGNQERPDTIILPELDVWLEELKRPEFSSVISSSGKTPLIIDNKSRIYLHRYFTYEQDLAKLIAAKCECGARSFEVTEAQISAISERFIKPFNQDCQQQAVRKALQNHFTVITGGPGTGKTTVVAAIIALMFNQKSDMRIALCAPTGKAQARLKEAITEECEHLHCNHIEQIKNISTSTIHSLLGVKYNTPEFKHTLDNPLNIDLLIIDEASMVALPLMTRLLLAVPEGAAVIMLGDKDQLASVESGAILADICETERLRSNIAELIYSYRFDENKGIGQVKNAINKGDGEAAFEIAKNAREQFAIFDNPLTNDIKNKLKKFIGQEIILDIYNRKVSLESYKKLIKRHSEDDVEQAYTILNGLKILCSHHNGYFGEKNINNLMLELLGFTDRNSSGVPVMITKNDRSVNLYNGDIGLTWVVNDEKRVYFPNTTGGDKKFIYLPLAQLPEHETVFAMTIHKSQGSGFENILCILPDKYSPLLTRELLYTAITRAKKQAVMWTRKAVFIEAVENNTQRDSGLKDKLA